MSQEKDGGAGPAGAKNLNFVDTFLDKGPPAAQPAETLKAGERFGERYEIVQEIGVGGMGVVYLAKDSVTSEEVVLKLIHPSLLDPAARQRMIAEGVNTRKVRNPHVVAVYDVGEHNGQVFLSMEHVEGRPLRAWMADNMAQRIDAPLPEIMKIIQEILSGLAAAHREGVIHRDLKPENIMIAGDPAAEDFRLKILDFGIARGMKTEVFTGSSAAMGTPLYMAPEQKTTPDAVGPSADIYSVGRMLYEMLMDVLPEGAWNPPSEQRADVPEALDQVIRKALQAPKHRYQSVAEFAAALDAAAQGTKAAEVSQSVWGSEGGDSLRASLKELDSTINERLAGGVKWLNESIKGKEGGGAGTQQGPEPSPDGGPSDARKRAFMIGGGLLAASVVAAIVLNEPATDADWPDPDPDWPDPEPNWPDPPVRPEPPLSQAQPVVGGAWRMEGGSVFSIRQEGDFITGQGQTGGWGPVGMRGSYEGTIEVFSLMNNALLGRMTGGLRSHSDGYPGFDWVGTMNEINTGASYPLVFHINH